MADALHLVALCGSLRAGSYNRSLLAALPPLAPEGMSIEVLAWGHLPVLNTDLEVDGVPPAEVRALQQRIRAADGLLICTPEYNHSIPGGLKNTIDWLSRGPMPHGLFEVPTAILGASDGTIGTTRAQAILRQTLAALNAPTLPSPQVLVALAHKKFDAEGQLTDEGTREFLRSYLVAVARWMRRFPRADRG